METGGTANDRRDEANRILQMLRDYSVDLLEVGTEREAEFVDRIEDPEVVITPRMIFWLRDIKDKYL